MNLVTEDNTKKCGHCKDFKDVSEFYPCKQAKSGLMSWCKACEFNKYQRYKENNREKIKEKRRLRHIRNRDKENAQNKEWWKNNAERMQKYQKEYRIENSDKIKEKSRRNHQKNKEKINERHRERYNKNKKPVLDKCKARYHNNKKAINEKRLNRHHDRMKNDPTYKLKVTIRETIRSAFRRKDHKKSHRSFEILGCDLEFFKKYIEDQFTKDMRWDNYGTFWWFDHKIALSTAKTEEDVIRLNHYTNFQPLYWKDNISKGDKLDWKPDPKNQAAL